MKYNKHSHVPVKVGLLLIDGFALLSYSSITEPLRVANLLSDRVLYDVQAMPLEGDVARSSSGELVPAHTNVGERDDYDLMIVIAGGDPFALQPGPEAPWLRHLARRGVTLIGVSGGPVILASAGVMQGYRMTLHWEHAAELRQRFPTLVVERSLYVIDRERMTCAGGTAPLDLMHALIRRQHTAALAQHVSEWLMHTEIRPAEELQRHSVVERYGVHHAGLVSVIDVIETHLSDPIPLDSLAQVAGVSTRQLTRLFHEQLGASPMDFARHLRLARARDLLRKSALRVADVGRATGFANAAHFATQYKSRYGITPKGERARPENTP